jgi:hypothetical protein
MRLESLVVLIAAGALAQTADASITVYDTFGAYDAAVGSNHTLFIDFATDKFGGAVIPSEDVDDNGLLDIEGDTFSFDVTYSSPDFPSSRVNIGDIGQGIDNEIGPFDSWDGVLRWDYTAMYIATAFTGVSVEASTMIRLYDGAALVGETAVGGTGDLFQFFGFTSTVAFDGVELDGLFFAIDAHYSTVVPAPGALGLLVLAAGARRRRR